MTEQSKEVKLTLTLKQMVFDKNGGDFNAVLDDTITTLKTRLQQIHANYQSTKGKGLTLADEEKGVALSLTITF